MLILSTLTLSTGCLVPQPLGNGRETREIEPRSRAEYYLYLPEAYVKNNGVHPKYPGRRWPLVMTFHGMKPYDTWDRQIHEWQEQADAYGFVVCAPWLQTCDSFAEFPPTQERDYVLRDKEAVIAIMDDIMVNHRVDPRAVLSTSWSSGGFIAHYMPNHFPDRFTCIATRLSNFSPYIMMPSTAPLYRDMPIAIFIGEADFPACITQSQEAVAWYLAHGFNHVEAKIMDKMAHQRIPQTAAAFFANQLGIEPLKPEVAVRTLATVRMHDWEAPPDILTRYWPASATEPAPTAESIASRPAPPAVAARNAQPQPYDGAIWKVGDADPAIVGDPAHDAARPAWTSHSSPINQATYRPMTSGPYAYPRHALTAHITSINGVSAADANGDRRPAPPRVARSVNVRLSGPDEGYAPFYTAFATDLPEDQARDADFLWTHNGAPIGHAPRSVRVFEDPGVHNIAVLVITADGQEFRGSTTVTVRNRPPARGN
jgi:poly(3-hydroxybutyrate) depolymerase